MLCVEIKLQKRLNCDNFWIRSLMAIVFILCRCETVIFALGIIYSVCLKHKCQTLNILVIFLTNPQSKFRSDLGFSLKSDFSTTLNFYWSDLYLWGNSAGSVLTRLWLVYTRKAKDLIHHFSLDPTTIQARRGFLWPIATFLENWDISGADGLWESFLSENGMRRLLFLQKIYFCSPMDIFVIFAWE